MGKNSRGQIDRKMAKEKVERDRDKILEGIIDTRYRSEVGIMLEGMPPGSTEMLLDLSYEDAIAWRDGDSEWLDCTGFQWVGSQMNELRPFRRCFRRSSVVGFVEVTPESWDDTITAIASRAAQSRMHVVQ